MCGMRTDDGSLTCCFASFDYDGRPERRKLESCKKIVNSALLHVPWLRSDRQRRITSVGFKAMAETMHRSDNTGNQTIYEWVFSVLHKTPSLRKDRYDAQSEKIQQTCGFERSVSQVNIRSLWRLRG